MEQGTGVEPASEAWEATIIADILTLHVRYYSKEPGRIQAFFVGMFGDASACFFTWYDKNNSSTNFVELASTVSAASEDIAADPGSSS